ncbi:MAG TPA: stage II sporulation protein M [Firmicutes bacterium]|uniref:Stage II sporulation protein M n=1 Tax=Candidatus Fermentithermobacillus carboniphilus TaxID=3085328 RepID=A0AAT9LCX0_9FIRM|nr:MAG: stage II sporulation protein M [Candidatus Fermentithermobacillus carboniphilus]HHW17949.1 stage II sporulation protein M [Candidatus Fermentithermobacillaceae bacterium]
MRKDTLISPLIACCILLVSGIAMGAVGLRVLSPDEKAELVSYLEVFMRGLSNPGLEPSSIFKLSLSHHLKTLGLLWAFGMAVVGVPLTCLLLIIRGFAAGFAAAFVIKEVPSGGFMVFAAGMLPHNLVTLPVVVLLSSLSISFSLTLLNERPWVRGGLLKMSLDYTWRFVILSVGLVLSSAVEAYVSPVLLKRLTGL